MAASLFCLKASVGYFIASEGSTKDFLGQEMHRGHPLDAYVTAIPRRRRPPTGRANARPMTGSGGRPSIPETWMEYGKAAAYWVPRFRGGRQRGRSGSRASGLLLHVLDAGKADPLGALAGIAEIELVLGHEDRIAINVVGDAGIVGGNERFELLAVVGGNPARELEFRDFKLHRQRIFCI